jgi:hypothetical protein
MPDYFTEDRRPCKDCGETFHEDALSDDQCFSCWVIEAEDKEDYELFLDDTLDKIIDDVLNLEGREI